MQALITGANRGLGLEIAKQLLAREVEVWLTMRSLEHSEHLLEQLGAGDRAHLIQLDVDSEDSVRSAAHIYSQHSNCLDILINNAGIMEDHQEILDLDISDFDRHLHINSFGPLRVSQIFTPMLAKSSSGRIINVSSMMGSISGMNWKGDAAYSISKAALNAITRLLATALRPQGIDVNSMCPGWCQTDMGGKNAPRTVKQGADTATWLALEASKGVTGGFWRDRKAMSF